MKFKKTIFIILGLISLGLGAIGAILPMLPTVPFLMLSAIFFSKSSKKLDRWFKRTKLYKNNLETFANGEGMTLKVKIRIMLTVTILMAIGFFTMFRKKLYIPCIILACVWLFHILYFCFGVRRYSKG